MTELIRILLADDHPAFLEGVRALLQSAPDITLVGEASDGAMAVDMALALQPDIILMDLQMPVLNGVDATRQIIYASPHIGVIMLTMFEDDDSVFSAIRAGARGYLLKGALKAELLRVVRGVAAGEAIFGSGLARRMMHYFAMQRPQNSALFPELTDREREILDLVAQGMTNAQIAGHLVVSLKTVRNHVSNILNKLQVADRTQAIDMARRQGMG
ncbi:MAG: response regulator transcription factor [Caldilineales bacterium]